jgi:hypothetical protein
MLLATAQSVYNELLAAVHDARRRHATPGTAAVVQLSQRVARLPGVCERLGEMPNTRVVALPAGAAALALPGLWRELTVGRRADGASFFSSRPWTATKPSAASEPTASAPRPTHLLFRNRAYPISANPLTIGTAPPSEGPGIRIEGEPGGIDARHCSVHLQGGQVFVTDLSSNGTFLNDRRVEGPEALNIGDAIRLGKRAETLVAIACIDRHEA